MSNDIPTGGEDPDGWQALDRAIKGLCLLLLAAGAAAIAIAAIWTGGW